MRHDLVWASVLAGLLTTGCGGVTGNGDDPGGSGTGAGGDPTGGNDGGPGSGCAVVNDVVVGGAQGTAPDVVWDGDRFTVVWQDTDKDGGDIQLAMFDATGKLITQQAIDTSAAVSALPSINVTANGYLVLWEETLGAGSVVQARYVGADGTPTGSAAMIATSGTAARPDATTGSAGTAAVWEASTSTATLAALNGSAVGGMTPLNPASVPAVLASGGAMGAVWSNAAATNQSLLFSRLASPGGPVQPVSFRGEAGTANVPRLAYDGSAFWVAWEDTRAGVGNENVYLVQIAEGGQVGGEISVPSQAGSANYPDVVFTGKATAVVYYQFRSGPSAIFLTRIGADSKPAGPDLQVSSASSMVDEKYPRVAWSGTELGVVYAEKGGSAHLALLSCPE